MSTDTPFSRQTLAPRLETARALLRELAGEPGLETLLILGELLDELQEGFQHLQHAAATALTVELSHCALALLDPDEERDNRAIVTAMQQACEVLGRHLEPAATETGLLLQINELRAIRGQPLVTETGLFEPKLDISPPSGQADDALPARQETEAIARLLLPHFRSAHRSWLEHPDNNLGPEQMQQVMEQLESRCHAPRLRQIFWVARALLEELAKQHIPARQACVRLLAQLEGFIGQLAQGQIDELEHNPPFGWLKNALFYLAQSTHKGALASDLNRFYRLDEHLPTLEDLAAHYRQEARQPSFRHGIFLELDTILRHAEHLLSPAATSSQPTAMQKLQRARRSLRRAAETLRRLGRKAESEQIQTQLALLDAIAQGRQQASQPLLESIHLSLTRLQRQLRPPAPAPKRSDDQHVVPLTDFIRHCLREVDQLHKLVTQQRRQPQGVLSPAMDHSIRSLQAQAELMEIDEFTATVDLLRHYLDRIEQGSKRLTPELLDILDEFCLTTRGMLQDVLAAEQNLHAPSEPAAQPPDLTQVFRDEAGKLLDQAEALISRWRTRDELRQLRRLLQRLKGSARMAGFLGLGEPLDLMLQAMERQAPVAEHDQRLRETLLTAITGLRSMLDDGQGQASRADPGLLQSLRALAQAPSAPAGPARTPALSTADGLLAALEHLEQRLQQHLQRLDQAAGGLEHTIEQVDIGERSRQQLKTAFSALDEPRRALRQAVSELMRLTRPQEAPVTRPRPPHTNTSPGATPPLSGQGSLLLRAGKQLYAIDAAAVAHLQQLGPRDLRSLLQRKPATYAWRGREFPIAPLEALLSSSDFSLMLPEHDAHLLLLDHPQHPLALLVDEIVEHRAQKLRPSGPQLGSLDGVSGITRLQSLGIVLILDPRQLRERFHNLPHAEHDPTPPRRAASRPPSILVIDDSLTTRRVTERLLRQHGFTVHSASDETQALAMLQAHRPDLVILDMELSGCDSLALAAKIRTQAQGRSVSVVFTSLHATPHQQQLARQHGASFLAKPLQENELLELVHNLADD